MLRRLALLPAFVLFVVIAGSAGHAPRVAHATNVEAQPTKLAVVLFENMDYDNRESVGVNKYIVGSTKAPYINNTILPEAINIKPSQAGGGSTCNRPNTMAQGTGTATPCDSGMYVSKINGSGFLNGGSAPEYAWLAMGVDANVTDNNFPSDTNAGAPEGGAVGFAPGNEGASANPGYSVWDAAAAQSKTYTVYAEDYLGGSGSCDHTRLGAVPSGWTGQTPYYARKHNPFLLTWNVSDDAQVVSGFTPASAPSDTTCRANMRNFPNNTPETSLGVVQTNFDGSQTFPDLTFISPSLCHMGHNSNPACHGDNTGTNDRGGVQGLDQWLEQNLDGIRESVGQDGTVILTWDESETINGTGKASPMPTFILSGTDSMGNPGTLWDCATPPCDDTSVIYDQSSTLRTMLTFLGSSCSFLDDNNTFGQRATAQDACSAATELPVTHSVGGGTPPPSVANSTHCATANGSATSLACSWSATGPQLAFLATKGGPTIGTLPTNWSLITNGSGASVNGHFMYYCASSCGTNPSWPWTGGSWATLTMVELADAGAGLDTQANNSSTGSGTATTVSSGSITTANAIDIVVAGLSEIGSATLSSCGNGFTTIDAQVVSGAPIATQVCYKVLAATSTESTSATFSPAAKVRRVIAAVKQ